MELKSIKNLELGHIELGFNLVKRAVGVKVEIITDGYELKGIVTICDTITSDEKFTPWDVLRRMLEDGDKYDEETGHHLVIDSPFKEFRVESMFTLIDRIRVVVDATYKYYAYGWEETDPLRDFKWTYVSKTILEFTY